jgi:CubicO group peptidase (beta-lactamase class C family)
MIPLEAITYSFFFGLLHGILPDKHTWPMNFGDLCRERIFKPLGMENTVQAKA